MKRKLFFMALAMMLFAVQGYAQRERNERSSSRRTTTSTRVESRSSHSSSRQERTAVCSSRTTPERTQVTRSNNERVRQAAPQGRRQQGNVAPRHETRSYQPEPPRHRPAPRRPAPVFRHHHGYYHHHYHCAFDNWRWYSWGGYHNRFICHRLYHNRFFDSLLGYYLWGALDAPTRIDIGNITFTRYNNALRVRIGNNYCSDLDLYRYQRVQYTSGYTTINVSTGGGVATIRLYDEYGNDAVYYL